MSISRGAKLQQQRHSTSLRIRLFGALGAGCLLLLFAARSWLKLSLSPDLGSNAWEERNRVLDLPDDFIKQEAKVLMSQWEARYNLANVDRSSTFNPKAPPGFVYRTPPHLQDCSLLNQRRRVWDRRGPKRAPPHWAIGRMPKPPWVIGDDARNLPLTRLVQTDIWLHQHPPDCSKARFLIAEWAQPPNHGLGSALHLMTMWLALALNNNRVLIVADNFMRSHHDGCPEHLQNSSSCYFFPVASDACYRKAFGLHAKLGRKVSRQWETIRARAGDPRVPVVYLPWNQFGGFNYEVPRQWGQPWKRMVSSVDLWGEMADLQEGGPKKDLWLGWWRAQGLRYILRFPSPTLCAVVNKARHEAYGSLVASELVTIRHLQNKYLAEDREGLTSLPEDKPWRDTSALEEAWWSRDSEVYIPRPIVNVHVRQGDKAKEMAVYSFASYMALAEKLRSHVPNMRYVWLSTEMQTVIDETVNFPRWEFFYTNAPRMTGTMVMSDFENKTGIRAAVENAFANLFISAECDFFIGALGSNWPRLINELRLTNGRMHSGYLTTGMWDEQ